MLNSKDLNFSFSGLKTAVVHASQKFEHTDENLNIFCMEIENSITDVLKKKVEEALYLQNAKSLIVGGGVSANNHIRKNLKDLCEENGVELYLSDKSLSTDNALMIAVIGMKKILSESEESDKENLSAVAGLSFPK
jgi:N6-L-threonylcarbamoyladenine synthase